jgi:hypothetical protein
MLNKSFKNRQEKNDTSSFVGKGTRIQRKRLRKGPIIYKIRKLVNAQSHLQSMMKTTSLQMKIDGNVK